MQTTLSVKSRRERNVGVGGTVQPTRKSIAPFSRALVSLKRSGGRTSTWIPGACAAIAAMTLARSVLSRYPVATNLKVNLLELGSNDCTGDEIRSIVARIRRTSLSSTRARGVGTMWPPDQTRSESL